MHRAFPSWPKILSFLGKSERRCVNQANESRTKQIVFPKTWRKGLHFYPLTCYRMKMWFIMSSSGFQTDVKVCLCEFVLTYYCWVFILFFEHCIKCFKTCLYVYLFFVVVVVFLQILGFSGIMCQSHYGHYMLQSLDWIFSVHSKCGLCANVYRWTWLWFYLVLNNSECDLLWKVINCIFSRDHSL